VHLEDRPTFLGIGAVDADGELIWTRPSACTMPLATSSPRVMPPKMLIRIERTFGSVLMTSSALAITLASAPPPISRKFAAAPPT
jgi:hypothetical protein